LIFVFILFIMRKRLKIRRKFKIKYKNNWGLIIIFSIVLAFINMVIMGDDIIYEMEEYVKKDVTEQVYYYVFNVFDEDILMNEDLMNIISLEKNSNGEIVTITYDFSLAYRYLNLGMESFYENISKITPNKYYRQGKNNVFFIPLGIVSKNYFFKRMGIQVPFQIEIFKNVDMGFKTRVNSYGLNNLLVELYLSISVSSNLAFFSENAVVSEEYEIVIASRIINGSVPSYYGGVIEKSSAIVSS